MYQRNFHRFFVLLAGLLLCLHTVVPHLHGAAQRTDVNIGLEMPAPASGNLLGFLQHLVGSNLGQDHLEHFVQDHEPEGISTNLAPAAAPLVLPSAAFTEDVLPVALRRQRVSLPYLFPPAGCFDAPPALRGPPARA